MRIGLWLLLLVPLTNAAEPVLIVKPEAFQTLVNPNCSHCVDEAKRRSDELKATDPVLMWTRGKYDGGAIPHRFFLNSYRVISDTYGVFVYDPDAGYARGFTASVDFTFHGWRNGIMVMKHKDGTLYSCLSGVAFEGPKKGERLDAWPTIVTNWGWTMKNYPNGVAYHMFEKYKPVELPTKPQDDSIRSRDKADPTLPADEMVLGIYKGGRARPHAHRIADLATKGKYAVVSDRFECGNSIVIFWDGPQQSATAYAPIAEKRAAVKELGVQGVVEDTSKDLLEFAVDERTPEAPYVDKATGSRFDLAGRCVDGKLKGWTLRTYDAVMVKWFAWAADYPYTVLAEHKLTAPKGAPPKEAPKLVPPMAKVDPKTAVIEVAGTAEFLRATPKKFGTFHAYDAKTRTITLQLDGEATPKAWPVLPDAEIKRAGWWGRPEELQAKERIWVWFACDRAKQPNAILMLCDANTELDIHGKPTPEGFAKLQQAQQASLTKRWQQEGLPGSISFAHIAGEVEVMLDHEAMRWGRSLTVGTKVQLTEPDNSAATIAAVVKDMKAWRERTRVTVVVNGTDIAPLVSGKRTFLRMPTPSDAILTSIYPPDMEQPRTKEERVEWFLASIYCTCKVTNDICTGDFYTLASCNPNGCGMPNATRRQIGTWIEQGWTNRQIFDALRKERGERVCQPHLVP